MDCFFEHSPDPMCVLDAGCCFQRVNPALERALGYSTDEITTRPLEDFVHPADRADTQSVTERVLEGERVDGFVNRLRRRDGSHRWFEWSWIGCTGGTICATARDISERKTSERRLAAQHATARVLAESGSLAEATPRILRSICDNLDWDWGELWMPGESGEHLACIDLWHRSEVRKPTFEEATHRTRFRKGEGLPGTVWRSGAPQWISNVVEHDNFVRVHAANQAGMHGAFAFPLQLAGETLGVMAFFSREIRKPDEQVLQMLEVVGSQIGQFVERRQAEQALRKSADRLTRAQKIANLGSWEFDLASETMVWSEQMYRIYGVDPEAFVPTFENILERVVEADRPKVRRAFDGVPESGDECSVEHRIRRSNGTVRWVFSQAKVVRDEDGKALRLLGTELDVTERKQAEEQLRQQIELEHLVAERSTQFIGMHAHEIDAAIEEALGEIAEFVGADRSRIVQFGEDHARLYNTHEWCAEGVQPRHDDLQGISEGVFAWGLDRLREGRPVLVSDVRHLPDKARRMRDFLHRIDIQSCLLVPLRRDGQLQGFTAFCKIQERHDWSEDTVTLLRMMTDVCVNALQRKRVEKQLFRIQQLVESASDAIGLATPEGESVYHNPAFEELFGYTPEELNAIGGPPALFVDRAKGTAIMEAVMAGETWQGDVEMQNRDGEVLQIALRGGPIRDQRDDVVGLVGIHTDITKRKQVEEALRETEKLAATGRMAAGIAHEINNPLAGIKNAFQVVQEALPSEFAYHHFVERIDREIERISGIVRQMYSLYRPRREGPSRFSLQEVLEDVTFILDATAREQGVSIELDIDEREDEMMLPEGSVNQILYNVVSNAIQASPEGTTVQVQAQVQPDTVTLRVRDEGPGIPTEIQSQIFEPFFTRRSHMPNGKAGMGLGLSVSKTLVESMGGQLWYETEKNAGTTFYVELPREQPSQPDQLEARQE